MRFTQLSSLNPTRCAPLCTACAHYKAAEAADPRVYPRREAACNHPGTPVDPITGQPQAPIKLMRARYQDSDLEDLQSTHCGLEARLFEALKSTSAEVTGQQPGSQAEQVHAS
ncbi:hypothetical protein LNV47_22625 [Paucibacter sp. DJ4R-1]|nr:hypothetical protein [Paucibacter sp. DJ4R-1]